MAFPEVPGSFKGTGRFLADYGANPDHLEVLEGLGDIETVPEQHWVI